VRGRLGRAAGEASTDVLVREVVCPRATFRLVGASKDGLLRRRGAGLIRLVHVAGEPVLVAVEQAAGDRVVFAARGPSERAAREGIARLRFAVGVDDDLREFHARFRRDPLIGRAVRANPGLRMRRAPVPWETLMSAITEQLIEFDRAVLIQRRLRRALGPSNARSGLTDVPSAAAVARQAPALLESCGLAGKRALAMIRAAREVASGRVDLLAAAPDRDVERLAAVAGDLPALPEDAGALLAGDLLGARVGGTSGTPLDRAFARLLAIPEIGTWTLEMLATYGLGRLDVIPAGDLGYLQLVGRISTGSPRAYADEAEVRGFFERYAPWAGLAGEYLRLAVGATGMPRRAAMVAA